mgnify:CR=1 FL=1
MSDDPFQLYNDTLLAYVAEVGDGRRLDRPDTMAKAVSPVCGSEVTLFLNIKDGRIQDVGYEVEACALTKTVMAVFLKAAPGLDRNGIDSAAQGFEQWLSRATDELPPGWSELDVLAPARDYTARHNSMLLPFTAALKALDKSG